MTQVQMMMQTHPHVDGSTDTLAAAVDALDECAQVCTQCADACLAEENIAELRRCIRLNLDCATQCAATAAVLGRRTDGDPAVITAILDACVAVCDACAVECDRLADMHEHCRVCADVCRRCARACRDVGTLVK